MIARLRTVFRRRGQGFYPSPHRMRRLFKWLSEQGPLARLGLRAGLTVLAVAHLGAAALLPAGRNPLFGFEAPGPFRYLTLMPVGDTMGFFKTFGGNGFLVYRIFTEQGKVVEGTFPDTKVTPRLRYDRWAAFSNAASQHDPVVHAAFLEFLVGRLPAPPLKVEMLAARWAGEGGQGGPNGAPAGGEPEVQLVLTKLGSYDGLRRTWQPTPQKGRK